MGVRLFDETNHTHVYINGERLKVDTRSEGQFQDLNWWIDGGVGDYYVALCVENPFDFPIELSWRDRGWYPEDDPDFAVITAASSSSSLYISAWNLYWGDSPVNLNLVIPPHETVTVFYWDTEDEITSVWMDDISLFYFTPNKSNVDPRYYSCLMDITE